jgi:type III pantothenate kinase
VIWAILVGNTRAVAALVTDTKILRKYNIPTDRLKTKSGALSWARQLRKSSGCNGIVIASVVPAVDPRIDRALARTFERDPVFIDSRNAGIGVKINKPTQAGADRLANAVAAKELYGSPSIVVDFGTATTFDVVDRKGNYRGGAILPGIGISLKALFEHTAKIPLVDFKKVNRAIGHSTEEAVRSGIYFGTIGTTRELLTRIRKEIGRKTPAIATGGWCGYFFGTALFDQIEPDLTLIGLGIIWRDHHA